MNHLWPLLLHVRADVTLVAGLLIAVPVTVHILLTKREVASAVGWIGLVWFAPFLGAAAYAFLGINRVRRRARGMRAAAPEPPPRPQGANGSLEHGIGRITGRDRAAGAAIDILRNGDQAYPAMLEAIAAARSTIGLSSYIFRDDLWGGRFIDALAAAHARGVAVRVIIDGIGGGWLRSPAWRRLRRLGVPAQRFLHSAYPWRMPFLNLRTHKKVLLLDGTTAFTGGMNIGDENVAGAQPFPLVQDLHFRVEGPVVAQLAADFARDWAAAANEDLEPTLWSPPIPPRTGPPARVIDSGPDTDLEKIESAIMLAVGCAKRSIRVMTPYFLPDERLVAALALAALRGVAVDIVAPARSNHALVNWALPANAAPLLQAGVRIRRSPPPFNHAKLMVVDGEWCLIGSCNWDVRSFRLNFELCLEAEDPDLAARLLAVMEACAGPGLTQDDLAARSLPTRLRDAAARLLLPYV